MKRKMLSDAQKIRRGFLKSRISFHRQEFRATIDERKRAITMRHNEPGRERKALLSRAADDLTKLANWHLHRAQKLSRKKAMDFPRE